MRIARALKTTPAYLTGETDDPSIDAVDLAFSPQDIEWIDALHRLCSPDRDAVLQLVRSLGASRPIPKDHADQIPVLQDKRLAFKGAE